MDNEYIVTNAADSIREILKSEGMSNSELANKMGVKRQSVNQLLNRNVISMRFDSFCKVTNALGYKIILRKDVV